MENAAFFHGELVPPRRVTFQYQHEDGTAALITVDIGKVGYSQFSGWCSTQHAERIFLFDRLVGAAIVGVDEVAPRDLRGYLCGDGTVSTKNVRSSNRNARDAHGQPTHSFNAARNFEKSVEVLLGICQGLIADDNLNAQEIYFLKMWLDENAEVARHWPGNILAGRVAQILADGVVSSEEADDLKDTLSQLTGGFLSHGAVSGASTSLPLDDVDDVTFSGKVFCLTGKFVYGERSKCEQATTRLGGACGGDVSRKVDYLVVGGLASRDWIHSSYGRKIEKAVALKEEGHPIQVIEEGRWALFI